MADYGDDQTNSHCDQANPGYNVVPTVVDEVQNVFEKSGTTNLERIEMF